MARYTDLIGRMGPHPKAVIQRGEHAGGRQGTHTGTHAEGGGSIDKKSGLDNWAEAVSP